MLAAVALALLAPIALAADTADQAQRPQVTVTLAAAQTTLVPGQEAAIGLHFALAEGWHVYWRNPGDSGEPPSVRWTLPPGYVAGAFAWPAPRRIPVGPLANYGYEGDVLLAVPLAVPTGARPGDRALVRADASWLVCREEECIPGEAPLETSLPVADGAAAPHPTWGPRFAAARAQLPRGMVTARLAAEDGSLRLQALDLRLDPDAEVAFFPLTGGLIEPAAEQRLTTEPDGAALDLARATATTAPTPERLEGVLTIRRGEHVVAHHVVATAAAGTLWLALVLAAAGGLLLNLMPCVFPVISLKVLSFIGHAQESSGRARRHGWAFAAGVLASFWVLAGALIALRGAGEQLGWGFQLQSPAVVAALAALMVLLGMNLAGAFEIGTALTAVGGRAQQGTSLAASFWTGALATVVATPCTAPFMGAALGWALTQPAAPALAVFTALGAGMAAPYLLLAHVPGALRLLPRPGAWMQTVRTLLAFPLFATALWLLWVFHLQAGGDAAFLLMAALLVTALAARLWGEAQARGGAVAWRAAGALALAAAVPMAATALARDAATSHAATADDPFWSPWSPEREDALRAAGQPVFVNYTAAWCLTCQVNERLVFADDAVREAFRRAGVTPLKADWTDRSDTIARSLDGHGRSGVPLYVLHAGGAEASPRLLPQLPTRAEVVRAVEGAASSQPTEESS